MKTNPQHRPLRSLLLACAMMLSAEAAAQTYFVTFSGTPSSIDCTTTSITVGSGVVLDWSLPPSTLIRQVEMVGATVVADVTFPVPTPTGSLPLSGSENWSGAVPFPFTFSVAVTPQVPGAGTSSLSFDCASATGSDFQIVNAPPFQPVVTGGKAIPTLDAWALAALAASLSAVALFALRRQGAS